MTAKPIPPRIHPPVPFSKGSELAHGPTPPLGLETVAEVLGLALSVEDEFAHAILAAAAELMAGGSWAN